MQTVLIVVHLLIVVALIVTVLLQRSEGGALGIGGGGSNSFFTGRGQANVLTRATAILAFLFFCTSLALTVLATYNRAQKSVFEQPAPITTPASPAPQGGPAPQSQAPQSQAPQGGEAARDWKADALDRVKKLYDEVRGMVLPSSSQPVPAAPAQGGQAPQAPQGTVLDRLKRLEQERQSAPPAPEPQQAPPRAQ